MKKIFCILLLVFPLVLSSCGSDSEENEDGTITVRDSEIISKYYTGKKYNLYFSKSNVHYDKITEHMKECVCDAICPIKTDHIQGHSISVKMSEEKTGYVIKCNQCKAEFDINTGKGLNDKAKNYKIAVYDYVYDSKNHSYTLWQRN